MDSCPWHHSLVCSHKTLLFSTPFSPRYSDSQQKPNKESWKIFSTTIRNIFCYSNSLILKKTLGNWKNTTYSQVKCNHFYDTTTRRLYINHNQNINTWAFYKSISNFKYTFNQSPGMPTTPPIHLQRITLNSFSSISWIFTRPSMERTHPNNRLSNQIHPIPLPKTSNQISFTKPHNLHITLPSHIPETIKQTIQNKIRKSHYLHRQHNVFH